MASIVRKAPLEACCITLDDVKQLYLKLKESVVDAAEYEIKQLRQHSWVGNDNDANKEFLDTYKVSVVINGACGQTLVDSSDGVFESPNLPDEISNIYFNSSSTY